MKPIEFIASAADQAPNVDYDRFSEAEIPNVHIRVDVNSGMRKYSGIKAIATIIHATAVECDAQGTAPLQPTILAGLANAIIELATDGGIQIEHVGIKVSGLEGRSKVTNHV